MHVTRSAKYCIPRARVWCCLYGTCEVFVRVQQVLIGRPVLWGLACGGQRGVKHVLDILAGELDNIMANSGLACIIHNLIYKLLIDVLQLDLLLLFPSR